MVPFRPIPFNFSFSNELYDTRETTYDKAIIMKKDVGPMSRAKLEQKRAIEFPVKPQSLQSQSESMHNIILGLKIHDTLSL